MVEGGLPWDVEEVTCSASPGGQQPPGAASTPVRQVAPYGVPGRRALRRLGGPPVVAHLDVLGSTDLLHPVLPGHKECPPVGESVGTLVLR
jgi:hypothetical protein